jgi:putative FmdB family regulatory protein
MPIYEYICRACGRETERLQKLSDAPLTDCTECGRPELARKISAPSFRLKGGGWYETDFKSDKEKKRNLAGDAAKPEAKTEGKADSKTEARPASKPAESKPAAPSGNKAESA